MTEISFEQINEELNNKIEELLISIGVDLSDYIVNSEGIKGPCFIHGGDNQTAFSYSKSKCLWSCFTNACQGTWGCSPIGLIKALKQLNYYDALDFAIKFLNLDDVKVETNNGRLRKKKDYFSEHKDQSEFDLSIIQEMNSGILADFCKKRNLDIKTVKEIGCKVGILSGICRFIVPICNIDKKIIGVSGRKIKDEIKASKWHHSKFSKSINMFGIDLIDKKAKEVIIVEGPLDVIKCLMNGIKNCLAILGCTISSGQIEILNKMGISNIVLAMDGDVPGKKASIKNKKLLEDRLFNVKVLELSEKDFSSMSDKDVKNALKEIIK